MASAFPLAHHYRWCSAMANAGQQAVLSQERKGHCAPK